MTTVHRLLDDAFAGVELTPEVQDLKEEIRANLAARADELQTAGASADEAARRAFDELGDVRALVADATSEGDAGSPADRRPAGPGQRHAQAALRHKVRPKPGFVVGVVLASVVGAGALAVATLGALDAVTVGDAVVLTAVLVAALAIGWITGSSLAQETTTNHPLPTGRSTAYGVGAGLVVLGAALAGAVALLPLAAGWFVLAGLALVAGVCGLSALGATQTNRKKSWAREAEREIAADNRFDQDPAAAARFGIYTAATLTVAFVAFAVLGFTVGWAWAWLALVGGFVVMLLVLARMLFGATADH